MALDTMFEAMSKELVNEVLDRLRDEAIIKLDQDVLSPVISQHQLAKELHKPDTWVHDNVLFNDRFKDELDEMKNSGAIQLKGGLQRTQVRVNRKAIKEFLQRHSNELPWLEGK
ncbi:DUF771 domain-containing protein [Pediococcus pentosaceus]|uniref:DUF771 domain-containing protein n=1 Tax=Pediococcus pentosaceus TaxID=1255 RepID=A0AA41C0J9_PEDPE|nr:DUF771 domain-containing protein [Pediococcus pentosaceus]KAF0522990.1 DUF771 domain-containing protein [Pediococcus pentosaceus]MBF7122766.1 DUF771 domain-containing protein [Pediococcus pentosaceus]MBF7127598.1 DUF771 domain-containing protein [Pediococcus pentosaceus]MBF7137987.1 DUF771 domain-containing protein [Pediococcus pentosaceus]UQB01172.1 DUF771 domain-containing protein [Pediococcus pentosaceus]